MRGKLMLWARRTHLYLGVFFSPIIVMFMITGWWQMMTSDDDQEKEGGGFLHETMKKFSNVHTSAEWPRAGTHHYVWMVKWLFVAMCVALIFSILLGLFLSWQTTKPRWKVVLAFALGIATPWVLLYIA